MVHNEVLFWVSSGGSPSPSWRVPGAPQSAAPPRARWATRFFLGFLMKTTAAARLRTLRSHLDCRPAPAAALEIQDDGLTAEELVRSLFALHVLCSAPCLCSPLVAP